MSEVTSQTDQTRALHAKIDELADNNQKLAATLRDAREQIIGLKNEVDKLSAPPNGYATYLGQAGNGLVNVMVNGRKMRVEIAPSLNLESLKPGQEVILNESMNVVVAGQYESHGEMATFHELLPDGERAIVIGRSEEERIVHLAEPLRSATLKQGDSLLYDTRSGFAFELVNKTEVEELILEEVPDINYTDIGGLGPQIEQIRDAVELPFLHRDLYKTYELKAPKGILLYGPPGCGKTLIAKAVANSLAKKVTEIRGIGEGRSYFLNVKGPELLNKYVGETERQIRLIFQKAREKANEGTPVIVFFDEMDSLFRTRGTGVSSDVENTIVPQLLAEIDGVESLENVIVIGASNREDMIDPAILRPGRLDVKIKIERPTATAAREIFRIYLTPDLPIHTSAISKFGDGTKAVSQMTNDLVDEMFSTVPANEFLEVTYANGEKETLYFKDFSSGAMIENIVARAKKDAIKNFLATGESGIKYEHLQQAARAEFRENEDLPNTTNPDDWARISGKKGERIVFMRTLIQDEQGGESGRTIDTTPVVNHYL
ncbi:MAG: proteasome ATPase [Actinomycetota bacterium]